jgi:hypothetical protein
VVEPLPRPASANNDKRPFLIGQITRIAQLVPVLAGAFLIITSGTTRSGAADGITDYSSRSAPWGVHQGVFRDHTKQRDLVHLLDRVHMQRCAAPSHHGFPS